MINLELKIPVNDLGTIRERGLAAGTRAAGILKQEDTFYAASRGLLKLRAFGTGGGELISYERPVEGGSKISDYSLCPVADPAALDLVLTRSLRKLGVVRKTRELLMFAGTRIHLDTVEGLGTFVELETEGNTRAEDAMKQEHEHVITILNLAGFPALPGSYAEMLGFIERSAG